MEMVNEALVGLLSTVIIGGIGFISTYITIYLQKATAKLKADTLKIQGEQERQLVNDAIDRLDSLIKTNVIKAEQTLVKEVLAKAEDGKIDREELKQIGISVKQDVLDQLGNQVLDVVEIQINDIESYISAKIEETLAEMKGQIK